MRITIKLYAALVMLLMIAAGCGKNKDLSNQYFSKAYDQSRDGDHAASEISYTKLIGIDPRNADAYYNRGYERYMLAKYEESIEDYSEAIKLRQGQFPIAYINRAMSYEMTGDKQKAKADYTKAIEMEPQNGNMPLYMAMFLHREHDYANAMEYYQRASKLLPSDYQVWYQMGSIRFTEGNYNEALAHYTKAAELAPKNAEAIYWKGETYLQLDLLDLALNALNTALDLDPDNAKAYESRAYIYYGKGQYENAMEDGEKAVKQGRVSSEVCIYIGNSARMLGQREKAEKYLNRAIEIDPKSYYAYWGRGDLYYQYREDRKACEDLETALELVTNEEHKKRLEETHRSYCK